MVHPVGRSMRVIYLRNYDYLKPGLDSPLEKLSEGASVAWIRAVYMNTYLSCQFPSAIRASILNILYPGQIC